MLTYPNQSGQAQTVLVPTRDIFLLGLYMGAWFLPPDHPLHETYGTEEGDTVPVGIGMVVPADRIIELLNEPELKDRREEFFKSKSARKL
jgi:hypothetical protein